MILRNPFDFFRHRETSYWHALVEYLVIAVLFAILIGFSALLAGCAETKADFTQHKKIIDPDTGLVVYEKSTDTGSFARAPGNASEPTTQSVTEQGVHSSVSGVHATTPEQIIAGNQKILFWIGPGFMGAGVLAFAFLKNKPLAIGLGIVGAVCLGTPMFLNELGPYIVPIVGVAGIGALCVWYMAQRHASNESSKLAAARLKEADQLGQQGKYVEALDTMRSATDVMAVNKPIFAAAINK